MAGWISEDLFRGTDDKVYQQVSENEFVIYDGPLPDDSEPQATDESTPSAGDVVTGLAAEIGISTAGQAVGGALGPLYPVVAFASGAYGNYVAQQIEGREDTSLGRMLSAGFINFIPGAKLAKIGAATDITKEVVKEAVKAEAKRGAAFGAGEATAISVIDENRLPTAEELVQYGALGATFGGVLGAASPKISKSFSKVFGKNLDDVDAAVARGDVTPEDIVNMGVTGSVDEARDIIQQTVSNLSDKQVIRTVTSALNSNDVSPFERLKSWVAPSKITGRAAQDVAFYGRNEVRANTEMASKLSDRIGKFLEKNPNESGSINAYLDNPIDMPRSLRGTPIAGDLQTYRETVNELQSELVSQLSEQKFSNLAPAVQQNLLRTIQQSMDETNPNYVSREYRLFTDPNFNINPKLKQEAVEEIAANYKAKNPKVTIEDARKAANEQVNSLVKNSAKNKKVSEDVNFVGSADSVIKARSNPGPAERAFLGEIVDPAERVRGTLDNVGRLVYKNKTDIAMANTLQKVGLAFKQAPDDADFTPLKLRGNLETGLYVPTSVQLALDKTYLAGYQSKGANVLLDGMRDLYESGVGLSKISKVVLNPPSYAVNLWGGMTSVLGTGVNPISAKYGKGLGYALAEYGPVDKILAGNSEESRKALTAAMNDMTKYGISNANVIASDIRSSFSRGFFSEKLDKAFQPISKAYQATDTAARFTVWAANQEMFKKVFPYMTREEIKLAAAKVTNDTYQNYDKLSQTIRVLSRTGVMPQFVSFTAEFMRNIYNQTRYATQMIKGNFGSEFGIDVTNANKGAMRTEGIKRLTALGAVIGGTEAARQAYNASNGIDEEQETALKQTVVADYDANKSLVFTRDKETGKLSYANLSYIVPHAMVAEAFNAALGEQPLESLAGILADNFVGEGTFVAQSAIQAINNVDANGDPISDSPEKFQKFKDQLNFFAAEAFKPGFVREADKLIDTATKEDPDYSFKELAQRQVGHRVNKIDIPKNSMFKIREFNQKAQRSASSYKSLLKYGSPTPNQLREEYQKADTLRRQNLEVVKQHYNNMSTIGLSEDERIKVMKDAGVSSKDIIAIMENTYLPLPTTLERSVKETYEERYQGLTKKQIVSDIRLTAKEDRALANKLMSELKERLKQERSDLSSKEILIKNLSTKDRAAYIIANPDEFKNLRSKGIVTKEVLLNLKAKGFKP